ncbi:hypothetical protein EJ05DRAFT_295026 [Pseudovirgaria hyperparasitica]|uniref:Uncharacterized protein n=1 Tax=Pseudovirgaria hyperparasitica TaxID=470096 RepID=A0A6A6VPN1_9PEZI|nr:uncharacterized protein EJ05DRAFT_295026 [Pseudovirgaria hyperparasitica]KAF2752588.1 hypothetical protein EJ05DRAFT_295026 [Pseudovirgaria hyperparasitica]
MHLPGKRKRKGRDMRRHYGGKQDRQLRHDRINPRAVDDFEGEVYSSNRGYFGVVNNPSWKREHQFPTSHLLTIVIEEPFPLCIVARNILQQMPSVSHLHSGHRLLPPCAGPKLGPFKLNHQPITFEKLVWEVG